MRDFALRAEGEDKRRKEKIENGRFSSYFSHCLHYSVTDCLMVKDKEDTESISPETFEMNRI